MKVIECEHITKKIGDKVVLNNIDLTINKGKIIGLLGANGSGKTTLLKVIGQLLSTDQGNLKILGERASEKSKRHISFLPDQPYFSKEVSVLNMLNWYQDFYLDFNIIKAQEMLTKLEIPLTCLFRTLSKGNQEKVFIIFTMSRNVDIYLLDEPLGGIDIVARTGILKMILENYNENSTILISTHLISDIETIVDEVILLKDGQVKEHFDVEVLRETRGKSIEDVFREVY